MTAVLVGDREKGAGGQLFRVWRLDVYAQQVREEVQNLQQVFSADLVLDHFQDVSVPLELEERVVEDLQRQWWRRRVELEHRRVQVGEDILNEARTGSRGSTSSSSSSSSSSSDSRWVD